MNRLLSSRPKKKPSAEKLAVRLSSIMGVIFMLGAVLYLMVGFRVEPEADLVVGERPWTRWSMDRPVVWVRIKPGGGIQLFDGPAISRSDIEPRLSFVYTRMEGAPLLVFLDRDISASHLTPVIDAANRIGIRYITVASREPEPEYFEHWRRNVPPDLLPGKRVNSER